MINHLKLILRKANKKIDLWEEIKKKEMNCCKPKLNTNGNFNRSNNFI